MPQYKEGDSYIFDPHKTAEKKKRNRLERRREIVDSSLVRITDYYEYLLYLRGEDPPGKSARWQFDGWTPVIVTRIKQAEVFWQKMKNNPSQGHS